MEAQTPFSQGFCGLQILFTGFLATGDIEEWFYIALDFSLAVLKLPGDSVMLRVSESCPIHWGLLPGHCSEYCMANYLKVGFSIINGLIVPANVLNLAIQS